MYSLILLGFTSFLLSLVLTPLCRNVFRRLGVVDRPDSGRKVHEYPIPRVGGIPIVLAYVGAFGILLLLPLQGGNIVKGALWFAMRLFPAAALVFAIGLLDDIWGLRPWQKLGGELAAAGWAYWAGVQIHSIAGRQGEEWWTLPLTIVWLIGCTNAFNLIDGVDGLAAGVGLFATATTLIAALIQNNVNLAFVTVPLAGCLLGFLRYNFNPATIFLGDCGSLLTGFALGCFGVLWSEKSATILGMTAPLMALAIPLLDTGVAIARRFLHRKPIFEGDRGHIHHRLLDRGLTPRRVALLLYGACAVAATFSLVQSTLHFHYGGLVIVIFCAGAWMGIQHLGYVEFGMAGRMLIGGAFRRSLGAQLMLRRFESVLAAARSPEDCWLAIRDAAHECGFCYVFMRLAGQDFRESPEASPPENGWTMHIPLSASEAIVLGVDFQSQVQPAMIAPFAAIIRNVLSPKLAGLQREEIPATIPEAEGRGLARAAEAGAD